jgi:hypothetical protein
VKIAWSEIFRLLGTDEFKVGVLLLLVSGLFLIPGAAGALAGLLRKRAYKGYAASISFGRAEIERALKGYVRHEGMLTDPSAKMDLADALSAPRKCIFRMLDDFIVGAESGKHLFIFADCGMGKTTFLINYFHLRRQWLRRRRTSVVLISLSKDGYLEEIEAVPAERRAETVILMDAFDEDPLVLEGVHKRLALIVSMTSSFKAVVISCRSQFFASDSEIPVGTGTVRVGPTPAGQSKEHVFNRFYLAPFDRKRIKQYIKLAFPGIAYFVRRRSAEDLVDRVPSLVMRPMLLAHISDVIDSERGSLMSQADIYQAIVSAWVKREEPWVVSGEALLQFSKKFALNIFELRHERGGEHCSRDDLIAMARLWSVQIRSELLTGRSLLNRTEDGRCKFAHRSIMEYFVSEGILDGSSGRSVDMTSQIATFLFERLNIKPSRYAGKLDYGSRIEIVDAEKRLGYSTNYNLIHEDGDELNPQFVYGLKIVTEVGESTRLGEHLQDMLGRLSRGDRVRDVRIAVSGDHELTGYLSVWSEHKAVLSRIRVNSEDWAAIMGRKWSARNFWNLVGRFASGRSSSADISYRAATYCNSADDFLGVDPASRCKVLSADIDNSNGGMVLRLIPGFTDAGPLAPFGILKGGSVTLVAGRKFALLTERVWEKDDANLPGRLIPQEQALVPPSERWDVRERG